MECNENSYEHVTKISNYGFADLNQTQNYANMNFQIHVTSIMCIFKSKYFELTPNKCYLKGYNHALVALMWPTKVFVVCSFTEASMWLLLWSYYFYMYNDSWHHLHTTDKLFMFQAQLIQLRRWKIWKWEYSSVECFWSWAGIVQVIQLLLLFRSSHVFICTLVLSLLHNYWSYGRFLELYMTSRKQQQKLLR